MAKLLRVQTDAFVDQLLTLLQRAAKGTFPDADLLDIYRQLAHGMARAIETGDAELLAEQKDNARMLVEERRIAGVREGWGVFSGAVDLIFETALAVIGNVVPGRAFDVARTAAENFLAALPKEDEG